MEGSVEVPGEPRLHRGGGRGVGNVPGPRPHEQRVRLHPRRRRGHRARRHLRASARRPQCTGSRPRTTASSSSSAAVAPGRGGAAPAHRAHSSRGRRGGAPLPPAAPPPAPTRAPRRPASALPAPPAPRSAARPARPRAGPGAARAEEAAAGAWRARRAHGGARESLGADRHGAGRPAGRSAAAPRRALRPGSRTWRRARRRATARAAASAPRACPRRERARGERVQSALRVGLRCTRPAWRARGPARRRSPFHLAARGGRGFLRLHLVLNLLRRVPLRCQQPRIRPRVRIPPGPARCPRPRMGLASAPGHAAAAALTPRLCERVGVCHQKREPALLPHCRRRVLVTVVLFCTQSHTLVTRSARAVVGRIAAALSPRGRVARLSAVLKLRILVVMFSFARSIATHPESSADVHLSAQRRPDASRPKALRRAEIARCSFDYTYKTFAASQHLGRIKKCPTAIFP